MEREEALAAEPQPAASQEQTIPQQARAWFYIFYYFTSYDYIFVFRCPAGPATAAFFSVLARSWDEGNSGQKLKKPASFFINLCWLIGEGWSV